MFETEVIDLSSDDDIEEDSLADKIARLDICVDLIDESIAERSAERNMGQQFYDQDRALNVLLEMAEDNLKVSQDLIAKCEKLGNPLCIETHCDEGGDAVEWDPFNECLIVPKPMRTLTYTSRGGVTKRLLIPFKHEMRDSGEESGEEEREEEDGDDDDEDEVVFLEPIRDNLPCNIPPSGDPVFHQIAKGEFVIACEDPENVRSCWLKAKINQIIQGDENSTRFIVDFISGQTNCIRSSNFVIACKHQPCLLKVQQRVVAHYRYRPDLRHPPHRLMAGFVAEQPGRRNSNYLIFFDNGKAGYVPHEECFAHLNCDTSEAIKKITEDWQRYGRFLEKYFESYPDNMKLRVARNKSITFWNEGNWITGKVLSIESSLVQIITKDSIGSESFWLYRGSFMLRDVLQSLFPEEYSKLPVKKRKRATHKVSAFLLSKKSKKISRKLGRKFDKKKQTSASHHVVTFSDDDSEYTDCSTGSLDEKFRQPKYVRERSSAVKGRTIAKRKEPPKKTFPFTASLFPESLGKRIVEGRNYFEFHDCLLETCLSEKEEANARDMIGKENPYAIPLILGWGREIRYREFSHPHECNRDVYYRAPCGRAISSLKQMQEFLSKSKCTIPIDLFTFEADLDVYCRVTSLGCFYYEPDISGGVEKPAKIPVVNETDDEMGPTSFEYKKMFTLSERLNKIALNPFYQPDSEEPPFDSNFLSCCSCDDDCSNPDTCECQLLTKDMGRIVYPVHEDNAPGYEYRRLKYIINSGIFECNSKCPCKENCPHRLVQLEMRNRLQVFKTGPKKGWGIRALHDIPEGTYLCQYVARILSPEEGNDGNHDDTYFADLDILHQLEAHKRNLAEHPEDYVGEDCDTDQVIEWKREMVQGIKWLSLLDLFNEGGTYVVDAIKEGNIGRFFNHSCDPNCSVQNVFLYTHDIRFPCICLFTTRTVKAMEELTWDYCYEVDSIPGRKLYCQCGSRKCRKRLL